MSRRTPYAVMFILYAFVIVGIAIAARAKISQECEAMCQRVPDDPDCFKICSRYP